MPNFDSLNALQCARVPAFVKAFTRVNGHGDQNASLQIPGGLFSASADAALCRAVAHLHWPWAVRSATNAARAESTP